MHKNNCMPIVSLRKALLQLVLITEKDIEEEYHLKRNDAIVHKKSKDDYFNSQIAVTHYEKYKSLWTDYFLLGRESLDTWKYVSNYYRGDDSDMLFMSSLVL